MRGFVILYMLLCHTIWTQVAKEYNVASWPGFKDAAVTYTMDDNSSKQLEVAIPIFTKYGFKSTMFVVTGWISDWAGFVKAYAQGHEIASHTISHPSLDTMSYNNQQHQLLLSKEAIEEHIATSQCVTMAYPYCNKGDMGLMRNHYIAARTCQGHVEEANPSDFYSISSIVCGSEGPVNSVQSFASSVELAKKSKGWAVFLLHGIDNDGGYSPLSSAVLEAHLQYMDQHRTSYWVATFAEAVKYIKQRNACTIREVVSHRDTLKVTISDTLPDNIYQMSLSIRRELPPQWSAAHVLCEGKPLETAYEVLDKKKYIVFNVRPDQDQLLIVKSKANKIQNK